MYGCVGEMDEHRRWHREENILSLSISLSRHSALIFIFNKERLCFIKCVFEKTREKNISSIYLHRCEATTPAKMSLTFGPYSFFLANFRSCHFLLLLLKAVGRFNFMRFKQCSVFERRPSGQKCSSSTFHSNMYILFAQPGLNE